VETCEPLERERKKTQRKEKHAHYPDASLAPAPKTRGRAESCRAR
jgi:hypothetical protein